MAGEKTEKATPKRKKDERKKGNIFQSKEVVTVFSLVVIFFAFKFLAPVILSTLEQCISHFIQLSVVHDTLTIENLTVYFIDGIMVFAVTAFPLLLVSAFVSIVATGAQTRFLFASKLLHFKASRISPLQGFKKMFSLRGVIELLKSILKIVILGVIIWLVLKKEFPLFPRLIDMSIPGSMAFTADVIFSIVKISAIIFVFLAAADLAYQWWDYEKNLRMSKQEVKEEYKEAEGDPQIKSKIKERQQQQARRRMMQEVPSADVVIRNPTHFAVAIRYDATKNRSPIVVAKGADLVALKIVEIAEQNHITVMENKPLARGLFDTVELEEEIPEQFFKPVAEVLAYVYKLKERERK